MLKGSILSYRMSCVQNLAVAEKQVGIVRKEMAEFPVFRKLRTSQLIFLWLGKFLGFFPRKKTFLTIYKYILNFF